MKLKDIIDKERNNEVHLYRQGVFWTAYEQSAYQIWKLKKYKLNVKFIKNINKEIVSLGFPDSALEIITQGNEILLKKTAPNYRPFTIDPPGNEKDFLFWRQNLEIENRVHHKNNSLANFILYLHIKAVMICF